MIGKFLNTDPDRTASVVHSIRDVYSGNFFEPLSNERFEAALLQRLTLKKAQFLEAQLHSKSICELVDMINYINGKVSNETSPVEGAVYDANRKGGDPSVSGSGGEGGKSAQGGGDGGAGAKLSGRVGKKNRKEG